MSEIITSENGRYGFPNQPRVRWRIQQEPQQLMPRTRTQRAAGVLPLTNPGPYSSRTVSWNLV